MMQNENPEKSSTPAREPFLRRAQGFCKRHWKMLAAAAGVLVIGGAVVGPMLRPQTAPASASYVQQPLERRDIVNTFNGSGTIQAADAYTVRTLVKGTVLTADFELGTRSKKAPCSIPWTVPTPLPSAKKPSWPWTKPRIPTRMRWTASTSAAPSTAP